MFKFRFGSQGGAAPAQPLTIETVRRRARHRLIGAAVLVLAGVIGFPLLFDTQPRPIPVDIPIDIPARETAKPLALPAPHAAAVQVQGLDDKESVVSPTPAPAVQATPEPVKVPSKPTETAAVPDTVPSAHAAPSKEPPKAQEPAPAVAKTAKPAAPEADKAKTKDAARAQALLDDKPAAAAKERIVVQVGAFAETARAQEVRNKLEHAGLKTYTHVAETAQGKRIRVRVGPFETKAQADKAAQKVKALGLPAAILTL